MIVSERANAKTATTYIIGTASDSHPLQIRQVSMFFAKAMAYSKQ